MEADTFNVQGIISKLKNKLANNKLSREGLLNEIMEFVVNPDAEMLANSRSETIFANNCGISSACEMQCIPCAGIQIPRPCRDPVGPNDEIDNPCNNQRFCRVDSEEEEEEEEEECDDEEEEDEECEDEEEVEEEEEEPDPCKRPCRDVPEVECDEEEEDEEDEEEEEEEEEEENEKCKEDKLEKGELVAVEAEKKPEDDGYLAEEELEKICSKYRGYDKKAQCREQICKRKRLEEKAKKEAEEKAKKDADCEEDLEVDPCEAEATQEEEDVCEANAEDLDCSCICLDDSGSESEYHSGDLKPRFESETKTSRSRSREKSPKGDYMMYRSNRIKSDTSDCAFETKPRSPKRRSVSPKSAMYFGEVEKPVVVQRKRSVSKERKENDYYTGYPCSPTNLSGKARVKDSLAPSVKKSNESLNYMEKFSSYSNRNNNNDDDDDDDTTEGDGDASNVEIDEVVVVGDESGNKVDDVVRCEGEGDSVLTFFEEDGPQDDYHKENESQVSETSSQLSNEDPYENNNVLEALKLGESKCVNTSYNAFLTPEDSENEGCYHSSEKNCAGFWSGWSNEQADPSNQNEVDYTESLKHMSESSDEETYCRTPPSGGKIFENSYQVSNSDDEIYFTRDPDDKETYLFAEEAPNVLEGAFKLSMKEMSPIVTLLSHDRNSPMSGFLDFSTLTDATTATDTRRQSGDSELCVKRLSECSPVLEDHVENPESSGGMSLASFTVAHCLRIFESLKKKALGQDDTETENSEASKMPVRSAPNASISASSLSFVEPVNFRKSIGGTTDRSKYYKRESHSAQRKSPTENSVIKEVHIVESPATEDAQTEVLKANQMLKEDIKASKCNSGKLNKSPVWKSNRFKRSPKRSSPRPAQVATVDSVFFGSLQESLSFNKPDKTEKPKQPATEKKIAKSSSEPNKLVEKEDYEGFGSVKSQRSPARGESGENPPKNFSFCQFHKKCGEKKEFKRAKEKMDATKLTVKKLDSEENHKHGVQNVQKNYKPVDEPEMKNKEEKTSGVNEYGDSSKGFQKIIENKQFLVGLQKYIGNTIRNQPSADKEPNGNNKILSKGHERSRSTHSWKVSSRSSVSDAYRTNGQKLTQYKRIKDKAQQQRRNSPTLIPPSSNSGREEFMERIMPLEFCDGYVSSKGYPVQNVSYTLPQEAGNVASDGAPLNDTKWWSHMGAVNIVHTQELHRDMKQGNSLIQEIIELATNGQSLNTAQNIQTVAGYSGDSKNQDIEAGSRCENPSGDGLQVDTSGGDTQGERGDTDVIGDTEIFISETQALTQLQTMLQSDGKKPTLPFENESTSQDSAGDYYDQLHPESNEKPEGIEPNEKWVWRASKTVPRAQNCGFEVEMPTPDDESPRRRLCVKRSPILALTRNVSFPTQHSPSKNRNDEEANNNKSVDNYLSLDGSEGRTTNSPNSNTLSVKSRSKAPPSEHDLSLQEKANSPQTKASENAEFEEETQGATALGTNRKVSKWVQMRSKKNENKEKEKKLEERQDMSSSVDYIPEFTTTENDIRLSENDIKLATFQQHDRKENDSSYAKKKRLTSNERDDGKHHKQFVSRPRWKSPQPQEPTRQQWVLSKNKQDHHHDTSASEDGFTPASRGHTQRDSLGKGRNETSRSTPYQAPEIIKTYTPYKAHTNSASSRPKPSSYRMRSSASDDRISREISKELALKIAKKREEFIKKASTKYASSTRPMSGKVKEDSRGSRSEHSTSQKEESRVLRHDYSTTQVKEENRSSKTERTSASQRKIRTSTSKENFQKSFATTINKRTSAFNAKKSEMSKKNKKNEKQDVVTDKEADEDNIVEETTSTRGNYTKHGLKSFKVESSKSTNSAVNIKEFNPGRGFEHRTNAQSGSVADNISRALNNDPNRVAAYQSYTSFDPEKVLRQQRNQAVSKNTSVIDYSTRYGNKEEVASNHRPFRSPPNLWYSDVDPVDTKTEPRRSENQDMSYFEPGSPNYSNQQRLKAKKQDSNTKLSETDHSYMSYNEYSAFRGSLNTHEPRPRSEKISVPQVNHYMISKSQKAVDSAEVIPPSSFKISSTYVPPSILTSTTSKSAGTAAKSSGSAAQLKKSGSTTHLKGILSKNNSKDKPSANSATKTASPTQVRKVGSATQIKPNIKPSRPKPSQQQPTQNNQKSKSTTAVEELPVPPIPTSPEIIVEEVSFPEKPKTQTSPSVGILSRIFSTFSRQTKQSPKLEETKNSKSKSEENFPKSADKLIKKSENKKKNQFTHGKSGRAENVNHNALPLGHSTEGLGMGEPEGIYLLQTDKHFQISEFQSGPVKNLNSEAKVNQLNEDKTDSAEQFLPSKDYMANINWNADTYLAERKRKKAEILENERKKKELEKQEKFLREALMKMQQKQQAAKPPPAPPVLEDDQIALIEEARRNDPKGPIYRWKKCKESLEGSSLAELNSTLTTLLEWNIVACSVLFLLVVAGFVPGFLPNLLACPIPSAWKGFSTYFLVPLGIDVMIYKWFEPSRMSLWSIFHFGAKEPSKGVFYSFVYNLVLALLKAIVYFIGYVVVPILSLPFLIIGPFLSAINTAIMCTTKTVFASLYTLFTNLTGLSIMRSTGAPIVNPTEPYAAANAEMPGSNEIGDDYVADVTTKLHHLRKHGSFLFYFGFDHPKPECNFSYLTGAFLWLTGRYPKECN